MTEYFLMLGGDEMAPFCDRVVTIFEKNKQQDVEQAAKRGARIYKKRRGMCFCFI